MQGILNLASPHQFKYHVNAHRYCRYKLKLRLEWIVHFPTQNDFVEKLQFDWIKVFTKINIYQKLKEIIGKDNSIRFKVKYFLAQLKMK